MPIFRLEIDMDVFPTNEEVASVLNDACIGLLKLPPIAQTIDSMQCELTGEKSREVGVRFGPISGKFDKSSAADRDDMMLVGTGTPGEMEDAVVDLSDTIFEKGQQHVH